MSPGLLFSFVIAYFVILLIVAWYTGRNSNNDSFFIGNRNSNWMLVAFGMIGTSLSGVTFVSVPGAVGKDAFSYMQITLGYFIGYVTIAYVLIPLYYRLQLTSIYNYLGTRFGTKSYKTGASFFILSRTLGATARLYLVVRILQDAILSSFGVPFWITTLVILIMILLYTYEGGVKTIVYTDTLQTTCMLAGLVICVGFILHTMDLSLGQSLSAMHERGLTTIFNTDPDSKLFFIKQILAGAFITITMTGLDQEMMQKNISVKTLKDSKKNMVSLAFIMVIVIGLFLFLGGLLHLYGAQQQVTATGDKLFPELALHHMPPVISVIFIIALISALFPSADGAMTALTSSLCIDILDMQRRSDWPEATKKKVRQRIHLLMAFIFLLFVMVFEWVNNQSMIGVILKVATYTYGPLLGLFAFGILSKRKVNDSLVPLVCVAAPLLCLLVDTYQSVLFGHFQIGLELLIINGSFTFIGLLLISRKAES
ncbi:sodium:solute symporter [Chitinophaga polysaccharea]|uniref:sodium:solute symporter n=1 Tax=Chitinophaga TaxID=79328 RepID=UPI0014555805|nr:MULTISPECIES: sodium:solute symporter [Chitinophaga]NLR60247.1 sodium:solute symporter [Chitinophaga polysaccharea]NLU95895.1 sodium:solute symporter [Chitinophaga sp. Ak27]